MSVGSAWGLRRIGAAIASCALLAAGVVAIAAPATAASVTATSGSGSWAGPAGWFQYINDGGSTTPATPGACTPGSAATLPADCTLPLTLASGSYDSATNAVTAHLGNIVWNKAVHGINLQFNDITVEFSGTTGSIKVDLATTNDPATPILPSGAQSDFTLATLDLSSVTPTTSAGSVSYSNIPGTFSAGLGTYIGSWGPYSSTATTPLSVTVNYAVPAASTATSLSISPLSPVTAGTPITLTSTSTTGVAGSVEFFSGATSLGTPVAVNPGTGQATWPISNPAAAAYSFKATFTPTDSAAYLPSTSSIVPFTVNEIVSATATTTAKVVANAPQTVSTDPLTTSPAKKGASVTLSTVVAPPAAGTVQFTDGGVPIGAPAAVNTSTGAAAITVSTLTAGRHALGAAFSPATPADFAASQTTTGLAYGIADDTVPALCTVDSANGVDLTGETASWKVSTTLWSFATKSATGNITVGTDAFEFASGTGTADTDCAIVNFVGTFTATNTGMGDMSYTFSAPTLTVGINGAGSLVADLETASPSNTKTRVTVATFTGASAAPVAGATTFSVTPAWTSSVASGTWSATRADAFPAQLILAIPASIRGFFYQSNDYSATLTPNSQDKKVPLAISASYSYPTLPTTTTLVASPAKPLTLGTSVTLTATVASTTAPSVGTVQFLDGSTVLSTQPVAAGIATYSTTTLTAGGHSLSASYIAGSGYQASASVAGHYGVVDPATPAVCSVASANALPVTVGTFSWAVSTTIWGFATKSADGNATVGANAFQLSNGSGTTDGLCTVVDYAGSFSAVNTGMGDFGFTFTNPTVTVSASGAGSVVAGVSWIAVPGSPSVAPVRVTIATFTAAASAPVDHAVSFAVDTKYLGSVATGSWVDTYSDSFPTPFVLALPGSVRSFFYKSSNSGTQPNKVSAPVTAAWAIPTYAPAVSPSIADAKQGDTQTFTASGFAPNEPVVGVVYSTPLNIGTQSTDETGSVTFSWIVPADFEAGLHTVVLTGQNSHAQAVATFNVTATVSCAARSISGATLTWGVKSSFRDYISGNIAQGSWSTSGVSSNGGVFGWSGGSGSVNTNVLLGLASYSGSVSFTGHGGLLQLTISRPQIRLAGDSTATLLVDVTSKSLDSGETTQRYAVAFATLSLASGHTTSANQLSWSGVPATLTGSGADSFAGFYTAGTALDPVSFSLPLGAEVDCGSFTSPSALASTGVGPVPYSLVAMLLLGLGGALVLSSRRREDNI
jgi:hypothetical protein